MSLTTRWPFMFDFFPLSFSPLFVSLSKRKTSNKPDLWRHPRPYLDWHLLIGGVRRLVRVDYDGYSRFVAVAVIRPSG